MPTKYFDISPSQEAFAYGFASYLDERRRLDQEQKIEAARKKAKRKKALTVGIGAGVGAIALPLAAPALGLAGTAGSLGAGGTAAGYAGPAAAALGTTASTAGIWGAGGALTGAGTFAAGLTGASLGARAGSLFADEDYAGAIGAVADPITRLYGQQRAIEEGRNLREEERAGRLSDALTLDRARTAGNIEQDAARQRTAAEYEQFGMPKEEATAQARAAYGASIRGAPRAGDILDTPTPMEPIEAYGPLGAPRYGPESGLSPPESMGGGPPGPPPARNTPGPSSLPGFDEIWGPAQIHEAMVLQQQRKDTIDNPKWAHRSDPMARRAMADSLARAYSEIGTTLVPHQPTMEERMQKESWVDPKTNITWHSKDVGGTLPPKDDKQEPVSPWASLPPEQQEAAKTADFKANHIGPIDPNAEYFRDPKTREWSKVKEAAGDGGVVKKQAKRSQAVAEVQKQFTTTDVDTKEKTLPDNAVVEKALHQREEFDLKFRLRDAIQSPEDDPNLLRELADDALALYGEDDTKWPQDVIDLFKKLDRIVTPQDTREYTTEPQYGLIR